MTSSETPFAFAFSTGIAARRFAVHPLLSWRRVGITLPPPSVTSHHSYHGLSGMLSSSQLTRLRLHLMRVSREKTGREKRNKRTVKSGTMIENKREISEEQRLARSARLRAKWNDPEWRAAVLAKRRSQAVVARARDSAKKLWMDPEYRAKMHEARLGRIAWNKGISPSAATRLRMSISRKGVPKSEETRRKMSTAKLKRPEGDDWPKLISEGKRGKTREYFQIRREFRALHKDLRLWSDSYRARYGRLPSAKSYDSFVAPMMLFRIRRYLTLREAIGDDETEAKREIISRE